MNTKVIILILLTILSCNQKTQNNNFKLPPGNIAVSFAVTSDMRDFTGDNYNYFRGACESIKYIGAGNFMISPGDIDPPSDVLYTIKKYIGSSYIWYPVAGNHETETISDMEWLRSYNSNGNKLPNIVNPGPPGCTETTYSFNYSNTHFVVINEYYDGTNDNGTDAYISEALYNWLTNDLENNSKPITLVFGHEPGFPQPDEQSERLRYLNDALDKYPANRDMLWNTLSNYNVKAYFCGHTHNYSVFFTNGVWQIDSGHSRGIGDMGARSTFVMIYIMDDNKIWYYTYRIDYENNNYTLVTNNVLN